MTTQSLHYRQQAVRQKCIAKTSKAVLPAHRSTYVSVNCAAVLQVWSVYALVQLCCVAPAATQSDSMIDIARMRSIHRTTRCRLQRTHLCTCCLLCTEHTIERCLSLHGSTCSVQGNVHSIVAGEQWCLAVATTAACSVTGVLSNIKDTAAAAVTKGVRKQLCAVISDVWPRRAIY
jgi:hypothetical protein